MSLVRRLFTIPIAIPLSAALSPARLESEAGVFGQRLGKAVASIHAACAPRPPAPPSFPVPIAGDTVTAFSGETSGELAAPPSARPKHGAHPGKGASSSSGVAGGIFVGKDTVLRLAREGVVPTGQTVTSTADHPAGIRLLGVGALGVGLSDGDILIEVQGRPVQTEAQVIGLVIGARSNRAEQISAVVWRGATHAHPHEHPAAHSGERWSLVVAMPYL